MSDDAKNASVKLYNECTLDDVLERKNDDVTQNVKDYVKYYISMTNNDKSKNRLG